jgi:hypothetical protein
MEITPDSGMLPRPVVSSALPIRQPSENLSMPSAVDSSPSLSVDSAILARLERLESQSRRMKFGGLALLAALGLSITLGWQGAPDRRISADSINCGTITAEAFVVAGDKGSIRLDEKGLAISAEGMPTGGRTNLIDHQARIEIGLDWEWAQESGGALKPTPRVLVGRVGHDTSNNLATRASILSPEGCHSGEWHLNNPKHDGRTDRDLIESLQRR